MEAFIIWTPFHLFNAVRYILSRDLYGQCDAYYICQSKGMEVFYDNVVKEGIFGDVFRTDDRRLYCHQTLWETCSNMFSPESYVKHLFGRSAVRKYDRIFMAVPTPLNNAIIRASKCKDVVGYDDGSGSYLSNLYESSGRSIRVPIKKTRNRNEYGITQTYLNNPKFVLNENKELNYRDLLKRDLTESEDGIVRRIFGYEHIMKPKKYIYLNQPLNENNNPVEKKQIEKKVMQALNEGLGDDLIVRLHPREKDMSVYEGMKIDHGTAMWEMICSEKEIEKSTLISPFSTAQLTPKMLFNLEPKLIFTYLLYNDDSTEETSVYTEMVTKLKSTYSEPDRIFIPASVDELKRIIAAR